jgi:YidC/Oxa1 family membrane protein insertase
MNLFDVILTRPIFNLLAFIYTFVADFGVAIIILTIIVRMILWPLIKKQLHQTKVMRTIQPELKKIKKQANGNRMVESQLMMELYKEKGVKPMGSMLVLVIQIPVFLALFSVIRIYAGHLDPEKFLYPFMQNFHIFANVSDLIAKNFTPHLFGIIDLAKTPSQYAPALVLALLAAGFQFWQSKQVMPQQQNSRKLRDIFKDASDGKKADQSEMMAATTGKMIYFFPIMTFMVAIALPGAVVLYYAITSIVAVIQQGILLRRDDTELLQEANEKSKISRKSSIKEAEIVVKPAKEISRKSQKSSKTSTNKSGTNSTTVVRRIKAK